MLLRNSVRVALFVVEHNDMNIDKCKHVLNVLLNGLYRDISAATSFSLNVHSPSYKNTRLS